MSGSEALGSEGEQAQGDPGTGEVVEGAEEVEGGEQQPSRQYVEVDDPDQRFVRVKVDGQDVEVPYSEALRGYSREADYTQKTQALSAQRQEAEFGLRLQQALQADPEATLRILAERFGPKQQQQQQATTPPEFDDPLERQLWEERQARVALEERLNRFDQQQTERTHDELLTRTIGDIRTQFGASDEDIASAVQVAFQQHLPIESLPMVYKTMAFDRIQASVAAHRQTEAATAAEEARRTAAKTAAAGIVSTGSGSSSGGLTNKPDTGRPMTIREAALAAFEEHGA